MTTIADIDFDNKPYVRYLDHGFVGLKDVMGDDAAIVEAARTSYGKGTKSVSEDRALIRYLLRHQHTSVFEMVEFKFHLKLPIFVMRQHVRHRTASINEYSGRYSVMTDEFYIPELSRLQAQSSLNKQGSGNQLQGLELEMVNNTIQRVSAENYMDYLSLINEQGGRDYNITDRQGLSRELARMVLPVNNYTEIYWKINLKNLLHYLKLRADGHAQQEIQDLANAIAGFVKHKCPLTWEAFEDYWQGAHSLSRPDQRFLADIIQRSNSQQISFASAAEQILTSCDLMLDYNLSKREQAEFTARWL
jgi:thymidylate synthase (FAD)